MKTITTKFIATVLNDDYTPAMLQADGDRRNELANMDTNELQTLIDRLADVIPMVNEIRGQKRQEAMKLLEGVVGTGSFASVQELLQPLQAVLLVLPKNHGQRQRPNKRLRPITTESTGWRSTTMQQTNAVHIPS